MANVSPALTWSLVRKSNAFLVKGRGNDSIQLSSEPGNLRNVNSFKYSGLTGDRQVGVEESGSNGVVVLKRSKAGKGKNKSAGKYGKVVVKKNIKTGKVTVIKAVEESGRGDLKRDALARYSKIAKSQKR